jgi:hypothetical protein
MAEYFTSTTGALALTSDGPSSSGKAVLPRLTEPTSTPTGTTVAATSAGAALAFPTGALPSAIASNVGKFARAGVTERMYDNLIRIAFAARGRSGELTATSVRDFVEFWSYISDVSVEPEFALSPRGALSAEWFRSQRHRLDLQFIGPKVIFGLIAPNSILEGAESPATVAAILKNHPSRPLSWEKE